ncbi:MAG: TerD family protein [Magnetococcales bacterium]|nr:TerD family protein [Magnetococcales bacterium]
MSISLQKGQKIRLSKESGEALDKVILGLGWDVSTPKKGLLSFFGLSSEIDLDASCLLFDKAGQLVDIVWFDQLSGLNGAVQHTGDNVTGAGEGDDEQIVVDLSQLPPAVTTLVFVVNSYNGQSFDRVQNAYCRLLEAGSRQEIARYSLDSHGEHTAMIMTKLYRHVGEWRMHAIGSFDHGKTPHDLLPVVKSYL